MAAPNEDYWPDDALVKDLVMGNSLMKYNNLYSISLYNHRELEAKMNKCTKVLILKKK